MTSVMPMCSASGLTTSSGEDETRYTLRPRARCSAIRSRASWYTYGSISVTRTSRTSSSTWAFSHPLDRASIPSLARSILRSSAPISR